MASLDELRQGNVEGTFDSLTTTQNLADPGGDIIGGVFGDEAGSLAHKISDPLGIFAPPQVPQSGQLEAFINRMTPEALAKLQGGAQQAVDLTGQATQQGIGALQPFGGTQAFDESSALLGAMGQEAQEAAIANIPFNEAQQFTEQREQQRLARGAAARGELGGGATLEGLTQLGGQQVQRRIQDRLSGLSGLSDIERGVGSTISGLTEAGATRQAQILAGTGPQAAAIRLGTAAPIVEARTTAAELAGLQGIARANQQAQLLGQFGQFAQSRSPQTINTPRNTGTFPTAVPGEPTFGASR